MIEDEVTTYLKKVLDTLDYSQTDISIRLNCTKQNINKKFANKRFSLKDLEEFANAMDCELQVRFVRNGKDVLDNYKDNLMNFEN